MFSSEIIFLAQFIARTFCESVSYMDYSADSMLCISDSLVVKTSALRVREVEDSQHSAPCHHANRSV